MAASRYVAVADAGSVKARELVAGNHPAVAAHPDAFVEADGSLDEARQRAEKAIRARRRRAKRDREDGDA